MLQSPNLPTGSKLGAIEPVKDWDKLTPDEKIERMRDIIKNQSSTLSRAQADMHSMKQDFKKHSHRDNEIVVPYNEYSGSSGLVGTATLSGSNNFF